MFAQGIFRSDFQLCLTLTIPRLGGIPFPQRSENVPQVSAPTPHCRAPFHSDLLGASNERFRKTLLPGPQVRVETERKKETLCIGKKSAVFRIRSDVATATTQSINHYTITAHHDLRGGVLPCALRVPRKSLQRTALLSSRTTTGIRILVSFMLALHFFLPSSQL